MVFRATVVWLIIIGIETVHGILRRLLLVPMVGESRSNQIGVFIGSVLVLFVAWSFSGWLHAESILAKLRVGLLWCVLTFCFEIGVGHLLGVDIGHVLAAYNPFQGGLMLLGMAVMFFSLVIVSSGHQR